MEEKKGANDYEQWDAINARAGVVSFGAKNKTPAPDEKTYDFVFENQVEITLPNIYIYIINHIYTPPDSILYSSLMLSDIYISLYIYTTLIFPSLSHSLVLCVN